VGRVGRRSRGRLFGFDRASLGVLALIAPGRVFGIFDVVEIGYLHRGAIGGLRVGPIYLCVERMGETQNDIILLGRHVLSVRVVDQSAPDSRGRAIGVDLGQSGGMLS